MICGVLGGGLGGWMNRPLRGSWAPRQEMRQALKGSVAVARLCVAGSQYRFEHDATQISRAVLGYLSSALGMDEDGYRVRTDKDASDSERQGNQGQGRRWRSKRRGRMRSQLAAAGIGKTLNDLGQDMRRVHRR